MIVFLKCPVCRGKGTIRKIGVSFCPRCGGWGDLRLEQMRELKGEKDMAKKKELTVEETLLQEIKEKEQELKELREEVKNLERYKQYEEAADELKAMHTAFMNSGFSDDQAFALVNKIMDTVIPEIMRGGLF